MKSTKNHINIIQLFLILILACSSCKNQNKLSKENHLYTDKVDIGIYFESYKIDSYGVGGDVYSIYLTDSIDFRKFVVLYYDSESFQYKASGDTITITKMEETGGFDGTKLKEKAIAEYMYLKSELQRSKVKD